MARNIDADVLIKMLSNYYRQTQSLYDSIPQNGQVSRTRRALDELYKGVDVIIGCVPTADVVEVKRGYWKPTDADGTWECSLCGGEIVTDAYGDVHPLDDCGTIGCPYCLAKMDGGTSDG